MQASVQRGREPGGAPDEPTAEIVDEPQDGASAARSDGIRNEARIEPVSQ